MEKLGKAWARLKVAKSRQEAGVPWLKWLSRDEDDIGEPSALVLKYNCKIVQVMVEHLQTFDPIPIAKLQKQALWIGPEYFVDFTYSLKTICIQMYSWPG